ncbi:hypothetical protein SAMN05444161_7842 [Rhizobiales bacterium GAS191]|jgi:hypothetical protein|nr:hypothetical protein SAMN05519103_07133 [Rhizobiales bacterium GAS113]SEE91926.1 hypothetical protein SAMN05444161_7842 [Rhizobiales bacterium GAS191]
MVALDCLRSAGNGEAAGGSADEKENEEIKERDDGLLNEALEEIFPASDPVVAFHTEEERIASNRIRPLDGQGRG